MPFDPSVRIDTEVIDPLPYFIPDQSILKSGTFDLSQIVDVTNQKTYMLKYNGPAFYEVYSWDGQFIYFGADDTNNHDQVFYTFRTPAQAQSTWMTRAMAVGSAVEHDDNRMSHTVYSSSTQSCSPVGSDQPFPFAMQLRSHIRNYNAGGNIGVVDVLVYTYNYPGSSTDPANPTYGQERFYFARSLPNAQGYSQGLGWIRWENYPNMGADSYTEGQPGSATPFESADFTTLSTQAPVQPQTQLSCGH